MSVTAARAGLVACRICGMLNRDPAPRARPGARLQCARCRATLHARKPDSLSRTAALLIAAYVLYLPANLLPILETASLGEASAGDTILSGVVKLWRDGWWPLAIVILVASIVIPLAKLIVLTYLVLAVRLRRSARRLGRTRLYRLVDLVGKWSMVDIYVGALLVSLVQFQPLAGVSPGPAAIAFGAVVVVTMFASLSFDPRLLWDDEVAGPRRG